MVEVYVILPVSVVIKRSTTFKSKVAEIPFLIPKVVEKVVKVEFGSGNVVFDVLY